MSRGRPRGEEADDAVPAGERNERNGGGIVKRFMVIAATALMTLGGAGIATAAEPVGGPGFGQHVAAVAPEHPIQCGAGFGACVSAMARGESCPHTH